MRISAPFLFMAAVAALFTGCDKIWPPPGKPTGPERIPPTAITDFATLFTQNCSGCHGGGTVTGEGGKTVTLPPVGASLALNDPTYLSLITPDQLRSIIANGVKGSRMSGFALENGGELTDAQIDILVKNIFLWKTGQPVAGLPAYSAPLGNAANGLTVYATYCASCHGKDGAGIEGKGGSVIDPAYLGLVTDQDLRTIVIAGRNELGMPDWQHYVSGKAMSDQEVSDVVAWLVSNRKNEFGQPLTGAPQ
jgi:cytochrome c oxidase cbb3-type subunit III